MSGLINATPFPQSIGGLFQKRVDTSTEVGIYLGMHSNNLHDAWGSTHYIGGNPLDPQIPSQSGRVKFTFKIDVTFSSRPQASEKVLMQRSDGTGSSILINVIHQSEYYNIQVCFDKVKGQSSGSCVTTKTNISYGLKTGIALIGNGNSINIYINKMIDSVLTLSSPNWPSSPLVQTSKWGVFDNGGHVHYWFWSNKAYDPAQL